MVNATAKGRCQAGSAMLELVVAIGLLASVLFPIAYSLVQEQRAARAYYYRAIAIEIVDGEMESLLAGQWRAFTPGTRPYAVRGLASQNLPPGEFVFSMNEGQIRLEWRPSQKNHGGPVSRVAQLPAKIGKAKGNP